MTSPFPPSAVRDPAPAFAAPVAGVGDIPPLAIDRSEDFWDSVRHQYLVAGGIVYLDNAAYGPPSTIVLETQERWQHQLAANPASPMRLAELELARNRIARFVGASSDEIALTRSTTEGLSLVLHGMVWQPGDEILYDAADHPAARASFETLVQRYGVRLVNVGLGEQPVSDDAIVERYGQKYSEKSRLLFLSHINRRTGRILPVKALADFARARAVLSFLDASQSFGAIDYAVPALGVDYAAAPGHKWISAGHGGGFAYFRQDAQRHVLPTTGGFYEADAPSALEHSARRYDRNAGQKNIASLLGFTTALAVQDAIGRTAIADRLNALSDRLRDGLGDIDGLRVLTSRGVDSSGPLTTFLIPGRSAVDIVDVLRRDALVHVGFADPNAPQIVRVSPHIHNGFHDIDRAVAAIARAVR